MKVAVNLFGLIALVGTVLMCVMMAIYAVAFGSVRYLIYSLLESSGMTVVMMILAIVVSPMVMFVRELYQSRKICLFAFIVTLYVFLVTGGLDNRLDMITVGMILFMVGMGLCAAFGQYEVVLDTESES